jgi:hypothetical protein
MFNNEISTYNELAENKSDGNIQIVTVDSIVYFTDSYSYTDSSINMVGKKKYNNNESVYKGDLLFKNISYIQTKETYFWPSLAFVGLNIFIVGNGVLMLTSTAGISPAIKIVYPSGGGGSCPYIYSWNGETYNLEGEAFGTALGKALETSSSIVFQNIRAENNRLKIKITNERPETHFLNKVNFTAFETDKKIMVYSDNNNKFFAVNDLKRIKNASDRNSKDLLELLDRDDNKYWNSDLSSAVPKYDFEDQLFVTLKPNAISDSLSLIISAINTEISNTVFSYLQTILGDEFVNFTKVLETDQEIIDILKEILDRSSLKIDVWDGKEWQFVDLIYPEANRVKFRKLARIPNPINEENELNIRLRTLSDVWEIDAINFDDTLPQKLVEYKPILTSFSSSQNTDFALLEHKDDNYIKLLPGQSMDLEYEEVKIKGENKLSYAITIDGYLYEWVIDKGHGSLTDFVNLEIRTPKIKLVKSLLSNMELLLPTIYDNWKDVKKRYTQN